MSFVPRLAALWRNLTQRARVERDLDDELRAALDLLVTEKIRRGMPPEQARRAAALELGGLDLVKEQVRDARAGAGLDSLLQDLRYAVRTVRRTPIVALTGALSLGIGIAGNTVVFSLADAYLFRDQPGIADPARLAEVGRTDSGGGIASVEDGGFGTFSYPNYLDYRARQTVFEGLAAYHVGGLARFGLGTGDEAVPVPGAYVSGNYFDVLGVTMARGRGFTAADERLESPSAVVVISHRLWQTQFDGAPDIVGRTVRLNGRPFSIVGVASPAFAGHGLEDQRLWVPTTASLGAVHGQAVRLILGQTGRLALAGIAIGLTAAALVTRLLEGMLYGVQPLDPISFAGGALLFGTLALVASLIPARRAASVNPVEALRAE